MTRASRGVRRLVILALLALVGHPALAAEPQVRWKEIFADPGTSGELAERWKVWGASPERRITRDRAGMRVSGGPDPRDDTQRVMLWALAEVPTADLRVTYDYTRHESASPGLGISSMLFLSAAGVPPGVAADPVGSDVPAPDFRFINDELDALRATYSTDFNRKSSVNEQVRLHLVPGSLSVEPDSPRDYPFTPEVTYRMDWQKVGDRLTVTIKAGDRTQVQEWRDARIAAKQGTRVGFYQQPYRDATYVDVRIYERAE